jgi:hypothetical protein
MWSNPYSEKSKSPIDALKDFKKSLEEETSGEFKAEISIRIPENSRGFPLPEYKFYIKLESYPVCFMTIRQTYCDLTNGINYYPVWLRFHFFDELNYDIKDHDDLIEKITEVIGSDKTGNFLEHLRRCAKIR